MENGMEEGGKKRRNGDGVVCGSVACGLWVCGLWVCGLWSVGLWVWFLREICVRKVDRFYAVTNVRTIRRCKEMYANCHDVN